VVHGIYNRSIKGNSQDMTPVHQEKETFLYILMIFNSGNRKAIVGKKEAKNG